MNILHEMGHTIGLSHQSDYFNGCQVERTYGLRKIMGGQWWDTAWKWYNGAEDVCQQPAQNDFDTLYKAFPWTP